ncbi:prohead protease/major capsid protein fusion protein [uncultured Alistipes sp.]|uniref:prohead protease/major capsid protein fusion protein n=1 Tax=uncultured Alistipes sp. TaxID=538949 RepID=UPI002611AF49|nr:prohead protease/major capsid protein fusion protein [uncultured Alistipes sp.]
MAKQEKNNRTMGVQYGRALVQPETIDPEAREVDVVCATERTVTRFNWKEDYDEMLVCEASAIRMDRANQGLPLLDCHNSWSVHSQVGRTVKVWVNDMRQLCARVRFSNRPEVVGLFQDVVDGIVKGISVGYEIYKFEREERPDGARPIYRATDWMPIEISLAPVPADIDSGIRAGQQQHSVEIIEKKTSNIKNMERSIEKGHTMEYTVEDDPVKLGDIVTIDDVQGVALADGAVGETITLTLIESEGANPTDDDVAADEPAADTSAADDERGFTSEQMGQRVASIRRMTRAAGLPDGYALSLVGTDMTLEQCSGAIIRQLAKRKQNVNGTHGVQVGLDAGTKKRMAVENALLHRIYPAKFALDDGAREFRGMSLVEIGRELLSERGVNTRGMDRTEVANAFFKRSASTSDFPLLFEGIIHKMLRAQYEFAPEFWEKIARQTSVDDFRAKGLYSAGVVNGMKKIPEGSEIKYTTLKESKETIHVESFAEGIRFTRQAFVNDDLGVFSIIPSAFVRHWNTTRGDLVWELVTENGKMSDNKTLFHADHGNLISGALNETSLAAGKTALAKQTDVAGALIRVLPRYLVVPPELEIVAKKLVTATTPAKSDDVNVFAGAFDVIVEPRLTDPNAWYLMADPYAVDHLYYAYLEGNEALRVNSSEEFKTDSMDYAVRGDFGAAVIDYRGLVKSTGK